MTPLLQPAGCCVLLVDPRARHLSRLDTARQADPARCLRLVIDATLAGAVPPPSPARPPRLRAARSPAGTRREDDRRARCAGLAGGPRPPPSHLLLRSCALLPGINLSCRGAHRLDG
jgi:hypothetical protein